MSDKLRREEEEEIIYKYISIFNKMESKFSEYENKYIREKEIIEKSYDNTINKIKQNYNINIQKDENELKNIEKDKKEKEYKYSLLLKEMEIIMENNKKIWSNKLKEYEMKIKEKK